MDDAKSARKARGEMETTYDGVAELWWDDESKLEETLKTEAGLRAGKLLLDDEKKFIDLENSPIWFAYEYPQINPTPENVIAEAGSSIKKVFFPLRHKSYLDEAEARKYWLTHHGPIVRAHGHEAGILCYRQVHRANSVIDASLQKARGGWGRGVGYGPGRPGRLNGSEPGSRQVFSLASLSHEAREPNPNPPNH